MKFFRPARPAGFTLKLALGALCCAVLLPNMPVNCLMIVSERDVPLFSSPLPHGAAFVTTYIHSVQLTPVVDEYRILQGGIWGWEARMRSQGAGLPFSAPEHGRFIVEKNPPWMVVQGGRRVEERIVYRIGNDEFGRNTWQLPPFDPVEIYRRFPSKRVFIEASVKKFKDVPNVPMGAY